MIFNDTSGAEQGLVQDIYRQVNANSATYPIKDLTRDANMGLRKVVSIILGSDGPWEWDDKNNTTLPIGTAQLNTGQKDYSFAADYLVLQKIEVTDSNGNTTGLLPFTEDNLAEGESLTDFQNVNGVPRFYDKRGESVMLYPAPNYTLAGGLKAYFQRNANFFVSTDTSKEPGFGEHLHEFISLYCQYRYLTSKEKQGRAEAVKRDLLEKERDIEAFYSYREQDTKRRITNRVNVKV